MKYTRTQIYLEPDDHRALLEEAKERGISLAALLREIVANDRARRAGPPRAKGFEPLFGVVTGGPPSDIARDEDAYKQEAAAQRIAKKTGREPPR